MRKRYIVNNEPYEYDDVLDEAINTALESIPTVVFLNKIQSFVNKFGFEITVFGEGDNEYGKTFECKVKQGFNLIIYEAPETSSRTDGILNCFEWLVGNNKLNDSNSNLDVEDIEHIEDIERNRLNTLMEITPNCDEDLIQQYMQ